MFSMFFQWRTYKVHLGEINLWLQTNAAPYYSGLLADDAGVTIVFSQYPGDQTVALIQQNSVSNLTAQDAALDFSDYALFDQARAMALPALPYKDWHAMIPAERKLAMGLDITKQDKIDLVRVYLPDQFNNLSAVLAGEIPPL